MRGLRGTPAFDLAGYPVVEAMGGAVHGRGEAPAIEGHPVTTTLHAFDNEDVLFEDRFPKCRVFGAEIGVGVGGGVEQMDVFDRGFGALRFEDDGDTHTTPRSVNAGILSCLARGGLEKRSVNLARFINMAQTLVGD